MKTKFLFAIFSAVILLAACKKDKYQPAGDYLTAGTNSNTVKTFDFTVDAWQIPASGDNYFIQSYFYGEKMNGSVMVYVQDGSDWFSIPRSYGSLSLDFSYQDNGLITVYQTSTFTVAQTFRAVVIPPNSKVTQQDIQRTFMYMDMKLKTVSKNR